MKTNRQSIDLIDLAAGALTELLAQVSGVRLEELRRQTAGHNAGLLARIDVFGHTHFLACAVKLVGELDQVRALLNDPRGQAFPASDDATRLVIAPRLSPEAQALCKQHRASFLDIEGNARLLVGELFISTRSIPCRNVVSAPATVRPPARVPMHPSDRNRIWKLPHHPAGVALPA